jgi:AraC-like DNA-binding protein
LDVHIPRLRFDDRHATLISSADQYVELARHAHRPVADVSFKSTASSIKFSAIRIGTVTITEGYSEAVRVKSFEDPQVTFILPIKGTGRFVTGAQVTSWRGSRTIMQVSYDRPMLFEADRYLLVALRLCPQSFLQELERISPRGHPSADRLMSCGVLIYDGERQQVNVSVALENLLSLIDNCDADETLLQRIGVDDVVYRLLAEMVTSQTGHIAERGSLPSLPRSARAVDIICDYVTSNIGSPLTISKMEKMVGLSGRAINYAFQQRFSCSPQDWQRGFLLDVARQRLLAGDTLFSVKSLSYELGFSSASAFSSHYRNRFHERPSDTLASLSAARPRMSRGNGDKQ